MVKSQIHAGGRGKGTFKSGFQGGVKLASSVDEAVSFAEKMLGQTLVTKQTGHDGRQVQTLPLLAEGAEKSKREFYLAVLLDRVSSRPLIMASTEGGMDIEEVAAKLPGKGKLSKSSLTPPWASCAVPGAESCGGAWLERRFVQCGREAFITGVFTTPGGNATPAMVELNPLAVVELRDGKETVMAARCKNLPRR